jgi:hypothetical protein
MAGTLEEAPFKVVIGADWEVEDSVAKPMGEEVFLLATLTHKKTGGKVVILKSRLKKTTKAAVEEFYAGFRDSLKDPRARNATEREGEFLGRKAKVFRNEIDHGGQTSYNESTIFIVEGNAWSIICMSATDHKEAEDMLKIFQARAK